MEEISVIVPVYNTNHTLKKCIESILEQTYKNFELILVDDGSSDGSELICDEYAEEYENVKLIRKKVNEGLLAARMTGVQNCNNDYIVFVDSDDWVEKKFLSNLTQFLKTHKDVDIISSLIKVEDGERHYIDKSAIESGYYNEVGIRKQIFPNLIRDERGNQGIPPNIVSKIFKKGILFDALMECDKRITFGEDGAITYCCMLKAKCIVVTEYCGYHYVLHNDSMSRKRELSSFRCIDYLYQYLRGTFGATHLYDLLKEQIDSWITKDFLSFIINDVYDLECGRVSFLPPFSLLKKGERVVIYGAGRVGKSFVRALYKSKYVEIVAIVDQDYGGNHLGYMIEDPHQIMSFEFDKVIIAVLDDDIAKDIKKSLVKQGIEENCIIWDQYCWA